MNTLRAAREMRRLQERSDDIKREAQQDYLAPNERSWRAVWRTFRWRELWTALAAVAWLLCMWFVWSWKANL